MGGIAINWTRRSSWVTICAGLKEKNSLTACSILLSSSFSVPKQSESRWLARDVQSHKQPEFPRDGQTPATTFLATQRHVSAERLPYLDLFQKSTSTMPSPTAIGIYNDFLPVNPESPCGPPITNLPVGFAKYSVSADKDLQVMMA